MKATLTVLAVALIATTSPDGARADVPDGLLSVGLGGGAIVALGGDESGHAFWMNVEFGRSWWRFGGVVGAVYPGGRVQTRAAFYGVTSRGTVARLLPELTLDASVLVGVVEPDAARGHLRTPGGLPPDAARWASGRSLLLSPAIGLRWSPAAPGVFLDVEGRLVNLSHLGLFFGAGLAF